MVDGRVDQIERPVAELRAPQMRLNRILHGESVDDAVSGSQNNVLCDHHPAAETVLLPLGDERGDVYVLGIRVDDGAGCCGGIRRRCLAKESSAAPRRRSDALLGGVKAARESRCENSRVREDHSRERLVPEGLGVWYSVLNVKRRDGRPIRGDVGGREDLVLVRAKLARGVAEPAL